MIRDMLTSQAQSSLPSRFQKLPIYCIITTALWCSLSLLWPADVHGIRGILHASEPGGLESSANCRTPVFPNHKAAAVRAEKARRA